MTAKFIKLYDENPNPKQIAIIKEVLQNGGLIIFPTDTVYGIGCDLNSPKGLKSLAQLKGVKIDKANFSFITDSLSNLSEYVSALNTPVFKLLKRTLPGPYTYILNGSSKLPKPFKNKRTVGIRIPDNNIVRAIVKSLGNPLAVSSLKDSDEIVEYSTDPELIFEEWQHKVAVVVDGGYGGLVPSTVIDCTQGEPVLVRQGKGEV